MKRSTFLKTIPGVVGIIPLISGSEDVACASPKYTHVKYSTGYTITQKQGCTYLYNDTLETVAMGLYAKTNNIIGHVYKPRASDYAITGEPYIEYAMGFVTPDTDLCKTDKYKETKIITGKGTITIDIPVWAINRYWEAFMIGTVSRLTGWADIDNLKHMGELARKNNLSIHWGTKPTIKYNMTKDMFELYSRLLITN